MTYGIKDFIKRFFKQFNKEKLHFFKLFYEFFKIKKIYIYKFLL